LAVATTDGASGDQKIYLAAPLSLKEIEEHFRDQIEARDGVFWDSRAKAVSATKSRRLGALVLEEKPSTNADPALIAEAMTQGVREMGLAALPWTDGARLLRARVMFLRRLFPEDGWPDLSDEALLETIADWLTPYLAGISRKAHLDRLDMHQILQSMIPMIWPAGWTASPPSASKCPRARTSASIMRRMETPCCACACRKCSASPAHLP
jgi:ATP-dependent helicase HrpB